jgi:chromate reductase, NAD(P)H dehydrogenase (quinone)
MTRILLVPGSTRDESLHTAALRTAARFAPEGISATLYTGLRELPAFVPGEQWPPAAVGALREEIHAADAVLFSTPEYAGSLPGSLKNLLDWLVDGGDLHSKPVAWLSVAPSGQDDGARETLETVLVHASARLLRAACIRLPLTQAAVDLSGMITDPQLHQALQDMIHALVRVLTLGAGSAQPSWTAVSSVYPVISPQAAPRSHAYPAAGRHPGGPRAQPPGPQGPAVRRPWGPPRFPGDGGPWGS